MLDIITVGLLVEKGKKGRHIERVRVDLSESSMEELKIRHHVCVVSIVLIQVLAPKRCRRVSQGWHLELMDEVSIISKRNREKHTERI